MKIVYITALVFVSCNSYAMESVSSSDEKKDSSKITITRVSHSKEICDIIRSTSSSLENFYTFLQEASASHEDLLSKSSSTDFSLKKSDSFTSDYSDVTSDTLDIEPDWQGGSRELFMQMFTCISNQNKRIEQLSNRIDQVEQTHYALLHELAAFMKVARNNETKIIELLENSEDSYHEKKYKKNSNRNKKKTNQRSKSARNINFDISSFINSDSGNGEEKNKKRGIPSKSRSVTSRKYKVKKSKKQKNN